MVWFFFASGSTSTNRQPSATPPKSPQPYLDLPHQGQCPGLAPSPFSVLYAQTSAGSRTHMLSSRQSGRALHNLFTHIGEGGRHEVPTGAVRDMVDRSITRSRRLGVAVSSPQASITVGDTKPHPQKDIASFSKTSKCHCPIPLDHNSASQAVCARKKVCLELQALVDGGGLFGL